MMNSTDSLIIKSIFIHTFMIVIVAQINNNFWRRSIWHEVISYINNMFYAIYALNDLILTQSAMRWQSSFFVTSCAMTLAFHVVILGTVLSFFLMIRLIINNNKWI